MPAWNSDASIRFRLHPEGSPFDTDAGSRPARLWDDRRGSPEDHPGGGTGPHETQAGTEHEPALRPKDVCRIGGVGVLGPLGRTGVHPPKKPEGETEADARRGGELERSTHVVLPNYLGRAVPPMDGLQPSFQQERGIR
jgi:hypothetical protein